MRVRASVKKRCENCKIIRRNGIIRIVCSKKTLDINKDKDKNMARLAGVDIPDNKRSVVGLTYIYGVGSTGAYKILEKAKIDVSKKVKDLTSSEIGIFAKKF